MRIRICVSHRLWSALLIGLALTPGTIRAQGATATGVSRDANPAISANALFLGAYIPDSDHEEEEEDHDHEHGPGTTSGMRVQELEIRFTSFVDPYWKADVILALPGGEGIEMEEGYVTSLGLPAGLLLKAGKFYASLGRQNLLHTHAFAFLDAPLMNEHLLGGEGLNEVGVSLQWLAPLPWFVEYTGEVLNGDNDRFASDQGSDLLYLGHLKSFHELGDATTVEWGASAASGVNATGSTSSLLGVDLSLKWRPLGAGTRRAFIWQTEFLRAADSRRGADTETGIYTQAQIQVAQRWWVAGRLGVLELPDAAADNEWRATALVALVPSEFSAVRLQYSRLHADAETTNQLMLQLNVTIGAHPAHRY
jgi:hypothetical protein